MSSNYLAPTASELEREWGLLLAGEWHTDVVAGEYAPIIRRFGLGEAAQRETVLARFGLVPSSAKSPKAPATTVNARSETAATRSSFKAAFAAKQWCIIPAQSLYVPAVRQRSEASGALAHSSCRPLAAEHRRPVGPLGRRRRPRGHQLRHADHQLRPAPAPRPLPPARPTTRARPPRSAPPCCWPRKTSTSGSTPRRAGRRSTSAPSARTTSTPSRRLRRAAGPRALTPLDTTHLRALTGARRASPRLALRACALSCRGRTGRAAPRGTGPRRGRSVL